MQRFDAIVGQLLAPQTASPRPSARWLAKPTTDDECRALREWAEEPAPPRTPATTQQIAQHLEYMAATLPSRGIDEAAGRKRSAVYASLLGGYSNEALAFMARRACQTLDWFPTPRQCLDLIAEYRPLASDQETALRLCSDYTEAQFERWMANLIAGQPIGDVPDQWKRIAVEQGALRRLKDGSIVSRALYHGPTKAWTPASDAA